MRRFLPLDVDLGILVLRLALAGVLLYHGIPKIANFAAVTGFMQSLGLPAPALVTAWSILVEVGGGLLLMLGVAVDLAAAAVAIQMIGAIATVHWSKGFDFTQGGWEHPFTVLVMALAVGLAGAGRYAMARADRPAKRV
ncbi:MAG TPA: DoxX family protein [Gemmatimonadales bacterium]|nr:DoxX family protein [Gemmatimonadales bacterium]